MTDLRGRLDALVAGYDYAGRIPHDPLGLVHGFASPGDQEIAGLIAAGLAYGRVDLFLPKLRALFAHMGGEAGGLDAYVRAFDARRAGRWLGAFRYRVTSGADLIRLFIPLKALLERFGSLGAAFAAGFDPSHGDIGPALTTFVTALYQGGADPPRSFKHLMPNPAGGSACKRLNLWLRWMVRRQPGVDLGLWEVPASHLILPLDTHTLRMAYNLGLTDRQDMSWRNAQRVTGRLRQLDPADPVKYDFALCHLGMSGACPARRQDAICEGCGLRGMCRFWG